MPTLGNCHVLIDRHYSVTDLGSVIGTGATVSISVTHVHIGASSDSASVPTSGSRINRVGVSHGNWNCFNKIHWCWFTSVISWLCFTSNRIPSKSLYRLFFLWSCSGINEGFRSRCAASDGADSEATAVGGLTGTGAGSRLTGWIEINRFKALRDQLAAIQKPISDPDKVLCLLFSADSERNQKCL